MDGVDVAAFQISPATGTNQLSKHGRPKLSIKMLGHVLYEFEPVLQRKMKNIIASGSASLEEICRLDAALGEEFAHAVKKLLRQSGNSLQVDLIGSHGQTIWHSPLAKNFAGVTCANTMQLGQTAVIAERTGIAVIGDFRVQDIAAGGQGAPLVCFADELLFGEQNSGGTAVLNIGGIANITVLDTSGSAIMAFDTGPGNMLADRCAERLFKESFDDGGTLASSGKIDEAYLAELLALPYFSLQPPKTTGRELFGVSFADQLIDCASKRGLNSADILATLTALTPASIAQQYTKFVRQRVEIDRIVLGGGGAENAFILSELEKRWPHKLRLARHEEYGISTKFKEALLFALLAYTSYFRIPNNVPACTGASHQVCLGKTSLP
jgi:anhydro-N-acetylmuramic acid kinase